MAQRYITLWRKTGDKVLEWDSYVSFNESEVADVIANLKKQGVIQYSTYELGKQIPEHTVEWARDADKVS